MVGLIFGILQKLQLPAMRNIPTLLLGVVETLLFDGVDFGFGWTTSVGFKAKICSTSILKKKRVRPKITYRLIFI